MTASLVFSIANTFVLVGWILLIFAPKWERTQQIVLYGVVLVLSLTYAFLIAPTLANFSPDTFSTLENVMALFTQEQAVAAGWVHYLAFDLFVGAYIVREGISLQIPRWQYTLCLPFTFMFGPIGLLFFLLFKAIK
ncbi:MAG: ABA4-like family protein [Bacteroidota bacterium]